MKIKFGDHEVVFSETVMLPQEEELWVEAKVDDWLAKIHLKFTADEEKTHSHFNMEATEEHVQFNLKNWNKLGVCFSQPAQFGEVNGKPVYLMLHGAITGHVRRLAVQVSVGAKQ